MRNKAIPQMTDLSFVKEITPGSVGIWTLVALWVGWYFKNRKANLDDRIQADSQENILRDHYAKEVHELRNKLALRDKEFRQDLVDLETRYQTLLETTEKRYRALLVEAEQSNARLKERVNDLEDELRGLVRIITQASADKVISLTAQVPSDIREAAERVDRLLHPRGEP